ncbi:MAG: nucleotide exchange factor GrpE [Solirubrobacterales bacterium]
MTSINDIMSNGTDGRGDASAGSRTSSSGRANLDPAEAETDSGSISGSPPSPSGDGGSASPVEGAETPEPTAESAHQPGSPGGGKPAPDQEPEARPDGDGQGVPPVSDSGSAGEAPAGESADESPDELSRIRQERDQYLDLAKHLQADFENLKKRTAKELGDARHKAVANVVRELLPVVDNIDRALEAAGGSDTGADALLQGIKLVHDELHGFLDRLGLTAIDSVGEKFDPNFHEALASVQTEGAEAGTVTEVHQRGFLLGDAVVRPARVVVAA